MIYRHVIHCAGQGCPAHLLGPADGEHLGLEVVSIYGPPVERRRAERREAIARAKAAGWRRYWDLGAREHWKCPDCRTDRPEPARSPSRGIEVPADCPF